MNAATAPPTRTAAAFQARPPQEHGRRARRALAPRALVIVVLTGQGMASLDAAIVNVAGPAIQRDLHLSGAALQLAIYSYLLVYAVAVVTGARLGGRYGFGRLFGYGIRSEERRVGKGGGARCAA